MLGGLKIRDRIALGFMVIVLALLVVSFVSKMLVDRITKEYLPATSLQVDFDRSVSSLTNLTLEFMLLDSISEDFYKEQKSPSTVHFNEHYIESFNLLSELRNSVIGKPQEDQLNTLQFTLEQYGKTFDELRGKMLKRGFSRYGLLGELSTLKASLKNKLQIYLTDEVIQRTIVEIELAHTNYLYSKNPNQIKVIKDMLAYPSAKVSFGSESESFKADFDRIQKSYIEKFTLLTEFDEQIGRTNTEGILGELDTLSKDIIVQIENITLTTKNLVQSEQNRMFILFFTIVGTITLIAVLLAIVISRQIVKPITKTTLMLEDIADGEGDLTKTIEVKHKDEIGTMSLLFNRFVAKIANVVISVQKSSDTVLKSTDAIYNAVDVANDGINEVSDRVRSMVDGSIYNASLVQETSASIEELSSTAIMIQEQASRAASDSEKMVDVSKLGVDKLAGVVSQFDEVKVASLNMVKRLQELERSSSEIKEIVNIINSIAEQTSLLALNASIEAARAGDQGRGFAVVAEEVRKLADQTKGSVSTIGDLVHAITTDIKNVGTSMKKEQLFIEASVEKIHETNEEFISISTIIEDIDRKINAISDGASTQRHISEEMAQQVINLSRVISEHATNSEKIGEALMDQLDTFADIAEAVVELKDTAEALKTETDKFIVDESKVGEILCIPGTPGCPLPEESEEIEEA